MRKYLISHHVVLKQLMLLTGAKIQPAHSPIVCDVIVDLLWGC